MANAFTRAEVLNERSAPARPHRGAARAELEQAVAEGSASRVRSTEEFFALAPTADEPALGAHNATENERAVTSPE